MPINFPSSPILNQTYTVGTKTWVWNGYAWDIQSIDIAIIAPAFNAANAGIALATSAYGAANTAAANTVYLQTVNDNQNTSISAINTLATAAYGKANAEGEINNTQNTNITNVNTFAGSAFNSANAGVTLATSAYGKANAEGEINNTQNTWITNTNTLAQAAYDHSNTRFSSSGGMISGNVTIQNNLSVLGNVNFIGNVNSIQVTGNSGQFFGYASNGFNALYAGIPVGYDFQPQTIFQASANEDGYAQINIQNINTGGNASSDLVATADNGTENDTYVSVGIGSSSHSDPDFTLVGPNDGFIYVSGNTTTGGGDLVVGTFLPQNDIVFAAGGMNAENEQMRITGSSNTISIRSNVDSSLSKSVLLGPVSNVRITGGSTGQLLSTDGAGNLSFINSPVDLAQAAFNKANAEGSINNTQNTNITNINTLAGSAFNSANAGITLATAAFNKANNALANTAGTIFGGDLLIGAGGKLNVLTVGGDEGGEILLGKAESNTTLTGTGVTIDVYQNRIRFFEQGGSARGYYLDISSGGGGANTNIMSGGGGSDTVAFAAYGQANAATAVNSTQNTNITSVNTFAQAAYNQANTVPTNINTRGIQTNASYYPIFVDANNATGASESLFTHANLSYNPGSNTFTMAGTMTAWNTTTPATNIGSIHIGQGSSVSNAGPAITFGARDASSGSNAQAGIYINSDGSYGTRMYLATTDSYAAGSKTAVSISETGVVNFSRSRPTALGNQILDAGSTTWQRITANAVDYGSYGSIGVSGLTNTYAGISFSGVSGTLMMNSGASGFYYSNSTWRVYWDGSGNQLNTGNVTAYASDKRLKKNVKPIKDAFYILNKIEGVYFDWDTKTCNKWNFHPPEKDAGLLAQDVQEVYPFAVHQAPFDKDPLAENGSKSGEFYLTVQYDKLVPVLVQANKQLKETCDNLENRVAELESVIKKLLNER